MTNAKPWYLSKTIWATLVSILATLASMFGFEVDDALRAGMTDALLQTVSTLAGIIAIFGRLSANSRIS